jgi:hypothetical protein
MGLAGRLRIGAGLLAIAASVALTVPRASAQIGFAPNNAPMNPRTSAPQDFTGYWVSIVTEDWRYRMLTPAKGDYPGIFLTPAGQHIAQSWDPAKDEAAGDQCKSYGAGAIMRVPTRLHISWDNDTTLHVETDAGKQVRLFHFNVTEPPAGTAPSWQGYSMANWEGLRPRGFNGPVVASGGAPRARRDEGYLKVITKDLKPGYVRKNGVPYGANAVVEEYFDSFTEPNGDTWLVVTAAVTDPEYLAQTYLTSSQFKKQADSSGWNPTPCEAK